MASLDGRIWRWWGWDLNLALKPLLAPAYILNLSSNQKGPWRPVPMPSMSMEGPPPVPTVPEGTGHAPVWVLQLAIPRGWAGRGRWSRGFQSPELWSRAAASCKKSSSWRAPRWPPWGSRGRWRWRRGDRTPRLPAHPEQGAGQPPRRGGRWRRVVGINEVNKNRKIRDKWGGREKQKIC